MKSLAIEISYILAHAESRRYTFIEGHFRRCRFALEFGADQVRLGYLDTAAREVSLIEKEVLTILRFMPKVSDQEHRDHFMGELDQILLRLQILKMHVSANPPPA